ncbi:Detected protein of confused Function [Hibiscus syriacus]|uniref:Detected protein of confused Function n=1 Tax=Hibiscus syriacus TaxID=106335 RepID=A0A6A2WWZ8_HIBSY|nr:Detected protein of confused Function [Hibiscus syriacus]
MADVVKQILAKSIQLADQITKAVDEAASFKQECSEIISKTEKLAGLLRRAERASSELYVRPTRRIIDETEQILDKALSLVLKCRANGIMKRVITIIPAAAFHKTSSQLENSIGDVSWLLRVSASTDGRDDEYLGLPPIASIDPILHLIWEQIAILYSGSLDNRSEATASLVSLARDNDRNGKLIIEEGGVAPLLKLVKEGTVEGQENAARAIGHLGLDPESVENMIQARVCTVFAKIFKEGPMKVQAVIAWAVSEFASQMPRFACPA